MMQLGDGPNVGQGVEYRFTGNAITAATAWQSMPIPPQFTMAHIFALGGGGAGGNGAVGANSTAAAGGGGASAGQTSLWIPTRFLPDVLYISAGVGGLTPASAGIASRVSIQPDGVANHCVAIVNGGGAGGNAAGATAGAAGSAGGVATLATMPLSGRGTSTLLAGQAGIIGGAAIAGAALTLPLTGLLATGGTGGGGLPATATAGTSGGGFSVPTGGFFPALLGGIGAAATTTPGGDGSHGIGNFNGLDFAYGGTGGGSSHGSATGAGLAGGRGGIGSWGSGGGGGGGALTGSTQGFGGLGGPGLVIITLF